VSKTFSRGCILLLGLLAKPVAAKEMPKNQPPVCSSRPNIAAFEKMENDRLTQPKVRSIKSAGWRRPMRYRRLVLEPGGSLSANDLVKNFLGRPQNTAAFQKWMGEEFESAPQSKSASEP